MIKKLIGTLVVGMLFAAHANAATISLVGPLSIDADIHFQLEIWAGDFPVGFGAGGVVVSWDDTLVAFDGFTFGQNVGVDVGDFGFSCPGRPSCPADTATETSIVWGAFSGSVIPPGPGPTLLGTLDFTALDGLGGDALFNLVNLTSVNGGNWIAANIVGFIDTPGFLGLTVEVNPGDNDGDGVDDTADLCPNTVLGDPVDANGCSDAQVDGDGDGVCNPDAESDGPSACTGSDNCPVDPNTDQANQDGDAFGDACDDDVDGDGVPDADEPAACLNTAIPEASVPGAVRKKNRYVLTGPPNNDMVLAFESDNKTEFSTADTGGCSCEQIIDALGLGGGHVMFGCSKSAVKQWMDQL